MARRILRPSAALALALGLALGAWSCKHDHAAPIPAPAAADSTAENARQARFDSEIARAHSRWQGRPALNQCSDNLKEKADAELCRAASSALSAVEQLDPAAAPNLTLQPLSDAALALVRLVERARYLSLEELGRARVEGDAGAAGHGPSARPPSSSGHALDAPHGIPRMLRERPRLKIADSPLSQLTQEAAWLERDVLRNLGAYLEYAPLSVRQAAFEKVKALQARHALWPALNHLLREAALLETDSALKQNLSELASLGLPRGKRPDQPTGSK